MLSFLWIKTQLEQFYFSAVNHIGQKINGLQWTKAFCKGNGFQSQGGK